MSFYTSLTGLNAATAQLGVTSNNIANVSTVGFKRSRADFGDIFATSPLQKASSTIGQGVSLKRVTQEFGQGNMTFSSNTLDLAISGDGFFPLKSADGFQDIFTRNGSFMMNDQYNVVNSAGQRLMAASVDSSGKANLSDMNVLTIPQKTTGMAQETSLVQLGLNFPADAKVLTKAFNRNDPTSYNKSTALTVYDKGGNGYLATVYYVKTQNASQATPNNKWQTYVYVGDTLVGAALQQATDATGEKLYVNQYGQLKPESEVSDLLVNAKTKMFSLDQLNDIRSSVPASITAGKATHLSTLEPLDFSTKTPGDLSGLFTLSVDGSDAQTIGLENLAGKSLKLSGSEIAKELTNVINRKFGDEQYFYSPSTATPISQTLKISVDGKVQTINFTDINGKTSTDDFAKNLQTKLNAAAGTTDIVVNYDPVTQKLIFGSNSATTHKFEINGSDYASAGSNFDLLGLNVNSKFSADLTTGVFSLPITPSGDPICDTKNQRFGMKVEYDTVNEKFIFKSGTTGDQSSIKLDLLKYDVTYAANGAPIYTPSTAATAVGKPFAMGGSTGDATNVGLGLVGSDEKGNTIQYEIKKSAEALRGITSSPAVMVGTPIGINVNNNFTVDLTNNKFVVSVDNVKGVVEIPTSSSYTLDNFIVALQNGINRLTSASDQSGLTGSTVSGVKVTYDKATNSLKFTTGTASTDSFIKVTGDSLWGLSNVEGGRGTTSTWIKPTQFTQDINGVSVSQYIDEFGKDTSSADGFKTLPEWSPVYFDRGELTFDTGGNLVSPKTGSQLDTVYLPDGKGSLTININYSKSTQFSSPFAVLSQSQDGAPEGDLVGLAIGDDGLVNASYSNGAQKSLGKVVLVNFSNPAGLRQIGDTSYYKTSDSGTPKYGEAGSAGFGTVRSGATERANVDLTQELVDLITEQRNFQANAKAIETSTSLTSTIIQIRN